MGTALDVLRTALLAGNWTVFGYFLLSSTFYLALIASAGVELRRAFLRERGESLVRFLSSEFLPTITILVPAHDEARTIENSVRSLLTLSYPQLEIVVVDDGSTDETLDTLARAFELRPAPLPYDSPIPTMPVETVYRSRRHPRLRVAAKANGGKADALNAALSLAGTDLVCAVDADTIIDVTALQRLVLPFVDAEDMIACGATIRVANGCRVHDGRVIEDRVPRSFLAVLQAVEYLRCFLFGRVGWNRIGGNLVVSGAFGLFRRDALITAGGYANTVGEDVELVVRLRHHRRAEGRPTGVHFVPDPIAWTEAPETLRTLGRQRERWHRGLTDALWRHRTMMFNPRYGTLGLVVVPLFLGIEWLAPVAELFGAVALVAGLALGAVNVSFALALFLVALGFSVLLSTLAILLEELTYSRYKRNSDRVALLLASFAENIGYRQLTVIWRLRGIVNYLRGRTSWGDMPRRGFTPM
jgi:cellulose synthase/poly-beta-1,6-N-acetylglucosamine synthase-like glycosyltransferase